MDKNRERPIKALIELPTWLGDCVMATPAIENIIKHYQNIEITIVGSFSATELIKNNQKILKKIVIDSKITSLYTAYNELDVYDVFFSFRGSFKAKILKFVVKASKKYQFKLQFDEF